MTVYVDELEAGGEATPAQALATLQRWREGGGVDMTEEG
jgi:hypothetical protein